MEMKHREASRVVQVVKMKLGLWEASVTSQNVIMGLTLVAQLIRRGPEALLLSGAFILAHRGSPLLCPPVTYWALILLSHDLPHVGNTYIRCTLTEHEALC